MNELGLTLNFYASEIANAFYCAKVEFPLSEPNTFRRIQAVVFFRPGWRDTLVPAFCLMLSQFSSRAAHVAIIESLTQVLERLRNFGYNNEPWEEVEETAHYGYIAPIDQWALWTKGYGLVRCQGIFDEHLDRPPYEITADDNFPPDEEFSS